MSLKLLLAVKQIKNFGIETLRILLKPLDLLFTTEKSNARYKKKEEQMTVDQATTYIAQDLARYVVLNARTYGLTIHIADYVSREDVGLSFEYHILDYLKRKKAKMAYYKIKKTIEIQEEIIQKIENIKGMEVTETIEEFTWERVGNYQKTYTITCTL